MKQSIKYLPVLGTYTFHFGGRVEGIEMKEYELKR
jgi:hypothetical protein